MDIQKEREAFEAVTNIYHCIYNADLNYYFSGSKFVPDDAERIVNAGWKAWQAAQKVAVPEGFVVVPKEPTQEIYRTFYDAFNSANAGNTAQCFKVAYKAMIEAQEQVG